MMPDLTTYDAIVVNSSAGKDSQAMLDYLVELADGLNIRKRLLVVHADLGKAEWPGTRELAEAQAQHYGLRFEAVKRPQGDLLEHIEHRGMWPSPTNRYCTSDHKRGQVLKVITRLGRELGQDSFRRRLRPVRILNCMGLRAEESPARAKKRPFQHYKRATVRNRIVDEWLPIQGWSTSRVWRRIKASGVPYHPAYDLGMPRLSCRFCIFAPKPALVLAGRANPELLDEYVALEQRIGHRFRLDTSMADVKAAVESGGPVGPLHGKWNM